MERLGDELTRQATDTSIVAVDQKDRYPEAYPTLGRDDLGSGRNQADAVRLFLPTRSRRPLRRQMAKHVQPEIAQEF